MTDQEQTEQTDVIVDEEVPQVTPKLLRVVVTNTVNSVTGELFAREVEYGRKDTAMKGMRQRIRDFGLTVDGERVTIRQAVVTDVMDAEAERLTKTIAFTDAVVSNEPKPAGTGRAKSSNARKNAADSNPTEADAEIIGIALSNTEDAREALMEYKRHLLIHAYNVNLGADAGDERLSHYSTKVQAVEKLLALATVPTDDSTGE